MKKNANILEYVEKYKYKYGIKYAEEGGKLVKTLEIMSAIVWIYSFFMLVLSILSFAMKFAAGIFEYSDFSNTFINTIICAIIMIAAAALFVCRQKITACAIAIVAQILTVLIYAPISVYGIGYVASFYWRFLIPAALLIIFAAFLSVVLIRARVKTNRLYNTLVEGIYKQYGTKDGEKLTDEQWQEFLTSYNPYKKQY